MTFQEAVEDVAFIKAAKFAVFREPDWSVDEYIKAIAIVFHKSFDEVKLHVDILFAPAVVWLKAGKAV